MSGFERARTRTRIAAIPLGAAVALLASGAGAQQPASRPADGDAVAVKQQSPRDALEHFYERLRANDFAGAATHLDLSRTRPGSGPELARQLGEVLDLRGWIDLSKVSDAPKGEERDGLAPGEDQVGTVRGPKNVPERLMMVRQDRPSGSTWVFAPETVAQIPKWTALLELPWIEQHLPDALRRHGPRDLTWWQWLALPLLFVVAFVIGRLLAVPTQWLLAKLVSRTRAKWDDELVAQLRGPIALLWAIALVALGARFLLLSPLGLTFVHQVLRAALLIAFFWALLRSLVMIAESAKRAPWANAGVQSALPLLLRIGRVFLFAIGAVMVISELGYPVASLLAGLGIGGLAIALAAQKTVENMFGSVAIGVDQPFRVGDFVKVEDFVGTVETLGLRSTRFRTLERTLITIPNGKLADMRIETFAARDRLRLFTRLGLSRSSTVAQLEAVVRGLEAKLSAHPKLFPEGWSVRLVGFGESSVDVEVNAWFATADWNEFTTIRQTLLLEFLREIEQAGTALAVPTRVLLPPEAPGARG